MIFDPMPRTKRHPVVHSLRPRSIAGCDHQPRDRDKRALASSHRWVGSSIGIVPRSLHSCTRNSHTLAFDRKWSTTNSLDGPPDRRNSLFHFRNPIGCWRQQLHALMKGPGIGCVEGRGPFTITKSWLEPCSEPSRRFPSTPMILIANHEGSKLNRQASHPVW